MKFKVFIMLCSFLLVACKEEADKKTQIEEPAPVVSAGEKSTSDDTDEPDNSEGDMSEDDATDQGVGTGDEEEVDDYDGDQDFQYDGAGEPEVEESPDSNNSYEDEVTADSEKFWLEFDCGKNCEKANLSLDLNSTSYAQVDLSVTPSRLESVGVVKVSSEDVPSNSETRYLANDIKVESLGNGLAKVTNNTSRKFSSILVMHTSNSGFSPLKIEFDSVLTEFSSVIYSGVPAGTLDYMETSPILNLDIAYKGRAESCDEPRTGDVSWYCRRHPTKAEAKVLKALSANVKWFMNTYHMPLAIDAFVFGHQYMGYTPNKTCHEYDGCGKSHSAAEDTLRYLFSLASTAHSLDVAKLETYKAGLAGFGGGRSPIQYWGYGRSGFMGLHYLDELSKGNHITYMHELGHAFGYDHKSGFTYGFPHFAGNYVVGLLGNQQAVEAVPDEVFLSKPWIDGNLYLKVYSSGEPVEKKLNLQGLSMTAFDSVAYVSESGDTIKVEFSEPPKQRFLVRVFSGESDLVMTKDIAPGMLMLDKRSTDDLLVINDDTLSKIIENESLLNSRIEKTPKKLNSLCEDLFRQGSKISIPNADMLTFLSEDSYYYEKFKGAPLYAHKAIDISRGGEFDFETLVFTEVSNRQEMDTINLACATSN